MTSKELCYRLCAYFAVNHDEELTVDDICTKWNIPQKSVHNWLRRIPAAFVGSEARGRRLHFFAGPELKP